MGCQLGEILPNLKTMLVFAPVLAFYKKEKPLVLTVNSSSTGLGAVLSQCGEPLGYASRALTPVQQNCVQIEKGLLAKFRWIDMLLLLKPTTSH